jgi:hypothetical protein
VSGCVPLDPATGNVVGGSDIEAQARQALKNLNAVITAGGSQISKVVKTTVRHGLYCELARHIVFTRVVGFHEGHE